MGLFFFFFFFFKGKFNIYEALYDDVLVKIKCWAFHILMFLLTFLMSVIPCLLSGQCKMINTGHLLDTNI